MKPPAELSTLHETAMGYAEQALLAKDPESARELFCSAFQHERKAAELLGDAYDYEPTRSVLYRSAATLARDCREYEEAKRLIRKGLAGKPPGDIARELKQLMEIVLSEETSGQISRT